VLGLLPQADSIKNTSKRPIRGDVSMCHGINRFHYPISDIPHPYRNLMNKLDYFSCQLIAGKIKFSKFKRLLRGVRNVGYILPL
jgi:hypothetical protein